MTPVTFKGKALKTPLKHPLMVPTPKLAEAIAEEMEQKKERHLLQLACTAIDVLSDDAHRAAIMGQLLPYADTDLVCYRAGNIPVLQNRQEEALAPIVAWAAHELKMTLTITGGLMPVAQPKENRQLLSGTMEQLDEWRFAALGAAAKPLHSILLALALVKGKIDAEKAFFLAHLEEAYESEQWGDDTEKSARIAIIKEELNAIGQFLLLLH